MQSDAQAARDRIARQSHHQAKELEEVASLAREVRSRGDAIREANADAERSTARVQALLEDQRQALSELDESLGQLRQLEQDMSQMRHLIRSVRQRLGLIQRVSEECRMLSLNASIEAVRAGEAGHSFAVVAQAMRELAQSTGEHANEIDDLVARTVEQIQLLAGNTDRTVSESEGRIEHVENSLGAVAEGLERSVEAVARVSAQAIQQQDVTSALAQRMADAAESNSHETATILGLLDGTSIEEVAPVDAQARLAQFVVIDVRSPAEWDAEIGRVPGARSMPIKGDLRGHLRPLDLDSSYRFVCRSGGRSMRACRVAVTLGFRNVANLEGGMLAWSKAGLDMLPPAGS